MAEYKTDVALMSVTNTKFAAVTYFHDWKALVIPGDDQIYDTASFERDGVKHSLVHAKLGEMGMTAAAATAMKVIYEFRPRYLIMVGIAAGVALEQVERQMYGDVVVPDIVWNYSAGTNILVRENSDYVIVIQYTSSDSKEISDDDKPTVINAIVNYDNNAAQDALTSSPNLENNFISTYYSNLL